MFPGRTGKIRANFDWVTRKRIALGAARGCNRGFGRLPLDWKTRPKIALGAARGITHARTINDENLVHGNIRSSNIFHNEHQYGLVSDVGLAKMTSQITFPYLQNAGYCAPEVTDSTKMSQASDVYNFGVVLLELVSGKSPKEIAIVRWITFIIRVKWTAEVIDLELLRYGECEDAMMKLLQIGMKCVGDDPESRPKMVDIVKMLEEIN
ncbi:hypothetical protein RD792_005431 [Penstemon davidsonii]|uniref:Protein kinase domain-containing protein n=1 Tax=Penstemon davidsonii TaxID=160366 RepID=A0ABR0DK52_9LAMI|nr:hypothetical protein RD792_005431 [Penstemon davidsonii]